MHCRQSSCDIQLMKCLAYQPPPQSFTPPNLSFPPPPQQPVSSNDEKADVSPISSPNGSTTPPFNEKAIYAAENAGSFAANSAMFSSPEPQQAPTPGPGLTRAHTEAALTSRIAPKHFVGATSTYADDVGTFNGGSYRISHRDTNTLLTIQLAVGCPIQARPGASIFTPITVLFLRLTFPPRNRRHDRNVTLHVPKRLTFIRLDESSCRRQHSPIDIYWPR